MSLDRILVIGGGAREAAMAWRFRKENPAAKLYCIPGNPGIVPDAECIPIKVTETAALVDFALRHEIELTLVGPEAPLVAGIADRFEAAGLSVCGPSASAAFNTEGSKVNFKLMLEKHGIPTAPFKVFDDVDRALDYIQFWEPKNIVIKADGLAGGKGVYLPDTEEAARIALNELIVEGKHGGNSRLVVVEERLVGWELSAMAITDGRRVYMLPYTQDYKRRRDGGFGLNTGGMGARTIQLLFNEHLLVEQITQGVVEALAQEECFYQGFIYLGIMMTSAGPIVLECNCRLGDPETQVILTSMGGDFTALCAAAAAGDLSTVEEPVQLRKSLCVVMTSLEYPDASSRNSRILGFESAEAVGARIFHGGTSRIGLNYSTGGSGRILSIVGTGGTAREARAMAYHGVGMLRTEPAGGFDYRSDIGKGSHTEHRG